MPQPGRVGDSVAVAARTVGLSKIYGHGDTRVTALDAVDLDVPRGRMTAVMGPSGSGKSTLLHCMAALDTPTDGSVFVGETDVAGLSEKERTRLRRDRIGFVFQSFNLVPTLDARSNILLPQRLAKRDPDESWLQQVIDVVGLGDRLDHRPAELSGGQQQRVAVARALAGRPEIVYADEPTGNLDSRSGAEVLGLLRRAVDSEDQTVVMVTHDPGAAAYADRVVFLADGRPVDELPDPDADQILDRLKALESLTPDPSATTDAAPTGAQRG